MNTKIARGFLRPLWISNVLNKIYSNQHPKESGIGVIPLCNELIDSYFISYC